MIRTVSILVLHAVALPLLAGCTAEVRSSSAPAPAAKPGDSAEPSKVQAVAKNAAAKLGAKPTSQPSKVVAAPKAAAVAKVSHVDAAGAQKLLEADTGVKILDVRTPREYAAGHLKGAINIDFRSPEFATKLGALDKSTRYLVHCRSGGRSTNALKTFETLGFESVVHLDGGTLAWSKAGLPLQK